MLSRLNPTVRQLVGSSYRDAIASADTIMDMEKSARQVVDNLTEVCDVLAALPETTAEVEANGTAAGAGSDEPPAAAAAAAAAAAKKSSSSGGPAPLAKAETDSLYAAGSRVKFLVDTPEKIWGSLEEREYLGAAKRFLAAHDVLECLESTTPATAAAAVAAAAKAKATAAAAAAAAAASSGNGAANYGDGDGDDEVPAAPMLYEKLVAVFPLVRQQAPLLDSFRAQIARRGRAGLEPPGLSPRACASALAAVIAVEGLSGDEALRLMLQTKRAWVRATLRRVGPSAPPDKVAAALARVLAEVKHAVLLLYHCFVGGVNAHGDGDGEEEDGAVGGGDAAGGESGGGNGGGGGGGRSRGGGRDVKVPAADGAPLVFAALHESDPQGTTFTGVSHPSREVARWVERTATRVAELVPPPPSAVAAECRKWLEGVAADVAKAAQSRGLLAGVAHLADLAHLEHDVLAAATSSTASTASISKTKKMTTENGNAAAAAAAAAAASERACIAVLGRPLDAWGALLEAPHLSRAQELLAEALSHAPLRAALDDALASIPPPAPRDTALQPPPEVRNMWGGFDAVGAGGANGNNNGNNVVKIAGDEGVHSMSAAAAAAAAPAPAAVRLATDLAVSMSAAMAAARKDALALGGVVKPGAAVPRGGRLAQLEPFIHSKCHAGVMSVAEFLASRLDELEAEASAAAADNGGVGVGIGVGAGGALPVERALLVAQVAQTACIRAEELSTLLGPASEWNQEEEEVEGRLGFGGGGSRGARGGAGGSRAKAAAAKRFRYGVGGAGGVGDAAGGTTGKLGEALGALKAVAERGFRVWAEAAAARAGAAVAAALPADESLTSNETPKDWEEEKVSDGGTGGGGGGGAAGEGEEEDSSMTLRLPALPSPYVLAALHAASSEALRCGGHLLAPPALHALAAAVAKETLGAYVAFLGGGGSGVGGEGSGSLKEKVSEKGVLQALFDVRLLVDVLAGGSRSSGGVGSGGGANGMDPSVPGDAVMMWDRGN